MRYKPYEIKSRSLPVALAVALAVTLTVGRGGGNA